MRATRFFAAFMVISSSCSAPTAEFQPEAIVAVERAALDRWGKGDPQGYVETYAPEITYFDPMQDKRIDGLAAMRELLRPIAGKVKVDSFEMIGPKVQYHGDVAVLSYNLASHGQTPTGNPMTFHWNSTAVYGRFDGQWKIIHSHWSFTKPELKLPMAIPDSSR